MRNIIKRVGYSFSIKDNLKKRMAQFLTVDTGGVLRNSPTTKERKYKNVEIAEDFKKIDEKRKKQRLENIKRKQILLENKIKNEGKLLTSSQTQMITQQLKDIKIMIDKFEEQIKSLTTAIEENQADYVLIEGFKKMTVLNHIKYMHYVHSHNPGYTLHPETIKAIQNIHYCVNHNLPVNRIALYEVMPEYFEREIGELEESMQKLIKEKNISIEDEDALSSVRFFDREKIKQNHAPGPILIKEQVQRAYENAFEHSTQILDKHHAYFKLVNEGKTPFRNLQHMLYVMLSDLKINYLPEEQALRKDILEIVNIKQQWEQYKQQSLQLIFDIKHNYVEPPPYIANHPVLMDKWEKIMVKYTNPVTMESQGILPEGDMTEVLLGENMKKQLRKAVSQKYDPLFVEAMNGDRSLVDKKKLQIQFYNLSTNIYENLKALQDKSSPQEQIFQKLNKKNQSKFLIEQKKKSLIKMEHLTRMIFLNNKNKNKYNLQFFSEWFGIDSQQLKTMLKTVSYLRVPPQKQKNTQEEIQYHIMRFQM